MKLAQFVLFDGFDPLDVVAPYEVLSAGGTIAGGALTAELVTGRPATTNHLGLGLLEATGTEPTVAV